MPPVVENNEVLVDGAVMRSFPATMMRNTHLGTVIGVDVTRARGLDPKTLVMPKNPASWFARGEWRRGPPIISVMMRSATITTTADLAQSRAATDLLIIPEPWPASKSAIGRPMTRQWKTATRQRSIPWRNSTLSVTTLRKLGKSVHPEHSGASRPTISCCYRHDRGPAEKGQGRSAAQGAKDDSMRAMRAKIPLSPASGPARQAVLNPALPIP